jgi:hypothetical protein
VNAVNAKHFEETQRLTGKLEDLARQLERKTANELGEGAEIDLFESLKQEFEGDQIKRVSKVPTSSRTWFTAGKSVAGSFTMPRTGTPGATST